MSTIDILVAVPSGAGWAPLHAMAELLARYTGGTVHTVDVGASLSKETKLLARLPRLKGGSKRCLVIASDPGQLYAVAQRSYVFRRYGAIYGWVIDSFWDDRIPKIARSSTYDRIFVTDFDDVLPWVSAGVKTPGVLPWGADVWSTFSDRMAVLESKSIDLLRVGRQPLAYEDDDLTAALATRQGLNFAGRIPFGADDCESYRLLLQALNKAKFLLAFSNSVSPTTYTHPTKEYITARWTDALASGVTVVGKVPNTPPYVKSCGTVQPSILITRMLARVSRRSPMPSRAGPPRRVNSRFVRRCSTWIGVTVLCSCAMRWAMFRLP